MTADPSVTADDDRPRLRYFCSQCRQRRLVEVTSTVERDRRLSRFRCLNCWHTVTEAHVDPPPPDPAEATQAAPGTPEKIAVMRRRVIAGEAVFHTHDAPLREAPDVPAGRPGVRKRKNGNWEAWFEHQGRKHHVGIFTTADAAIAARGLARLAAGIRDNSLKKHNVNRDDEE